MTNETIQSVLDTLNSGGASEVIVRQIGPSVWWGFFWHPIPAGNHRHMQTGGDEMFFIKAPEGEFAAAVLWHGPDEMHWYVAQTHRRQRILVEPLKTVILPFIFKRHQRESQSCSVESWVDDATASMKLAKLVGFREASGDSKKVSFEIGKEEASPFRAWPHEQLALSDLERVETDAQLGIRCLRMAIDNLRVRFSDHIKPEKLENLLDELKTNFAWAMDCVEDAKCSLKPKS